MKFAGLVLLKRRPIIPNRKLIEFIKDINSKLRLELEVLEIDEVPL